MAILWSKSLRISRGPVREIEFLHLKFNSLEMKVSLTQEKLIKVKAQRRGFLVKECATTLEQKSFGVF